MAPIPEQVAIRLSLCRGKRLDSCLDVIGEPNGFSLSPFPTCCRISFFGRVLADMTLVAALISGQDAVVAADGFAQRADKTQNQQAVKIGRLRDGMLLACVGNSSHAKYMLCALNRAAQKLGAVSVLEGWEEGRLRCPRRLKRARRRLWAGYQRLFEYLLEEDPGRTRWPHFLLVGRYMFGVGYSVFTVRDINGRPNATHDSRNFPFGSSMQGLLSLGAKQDDPVLAEVEEETHNASGRSDEQRLVDHIRSIRARSENKYMANDNILTRRLSAGCVRQWYLATSQH